MVFRFPVAWLSRAAQITTLRTVIGSVSEETPFFSLTLRVTVIWCWRFFDSVQLLRMVRRPYAPQRRRAGSDRTGILDAFWREASRTASASASVMT